MNSKQSGIYSITSKINGKRYIGSANRICDRWTQHKTDLRNNTHHSKYLQSHYNKYGEDDLLFSVVEIVEKGDLTVKELKELLLETEQIYLNSWEECQFNCLKIAGSSLGHKQKGSKYYIYHKGHNLYNTYYSVNGNRQYFSSHILEIDALKEVDFIKTLTENQLVDYYNECKNRIKPKKRGTKNYTFSKKYNNWIVQYRVAGKNRYFGCFQEKEKALAQIEYLNTLNEEQLLEYCKEYLKIPKSKRNRDAKYYSFNKTKNKWKVQFRINGKMQAFGSYKTEQEAIDKAAQIKLDLGI